MMKKTGWWLCTVFMTSAASAYAESCYMSFDYLDAHEIRGMVQSSPMNEDEHVKGILHLRVENVGGSKDRRAFFWLENPAVPRQLSQDLKELDTDSIYSPFLANIEPQGFMIKGLKAPTLDRYVTDRYMGIVDAFQYHTRSGQSAMPSTSGTTLTAFDVKTHPGQRVEIVANRIRHLSRHGAVKKDISILESELNIQFQEDDCVWGRIQGREKSQITPIFVKGEVIDRRAMVLQRNPKVALDKGHWFFKLSTSPQEWPVARKAIVGMSVEETMQIAELKLQEMQTQASSEASFKEWIEGNLGFLKNLGSLLASHDLDNEVSLDLFMLLGAINNTDSIDALTSAALHEGVADRDRFRALMGLESTNAPFSAPAIEQFLAFSRQEKDKYTQTEESALMLLGAYAFARSERVPTQFQALENRVKEMVLARHLDPRITLSAAGNLRESASDELVSSIQSRLLNTEGERDVSRVGAEALRRIGRSSLSSDTFVELWQKQSGISAQSELIEASTVAKDAKRSGALRKALLSVLSDRNLDREIRVSAVKALRGVGYGKENTEQEKLKQLMKGEGEREVLKAVLALYVDVTG